MRKITLATLLACFLTFVLAFGALAQASSSTESASSQLTLKHAAHASGSTPNVSLGSGCVLNETSTNYGHYNISATSSVSCTPPLAYGTLNMTANQCFVVLGACLWYTQTINLNYCTISANNPTCGGAAILSSGRWDITTAADVITSNYDELTGSVTITWNL